MALYNLETTFMKIPNLIQGEKEPSGSLNLLQYFVQWSNNYPSLSQVSAAGSVGLQAGKYRNPLGPNLNISGFDRNDTSPI
jgi:hypothetical protein